MGQRVPAAVHSVSADALVSLLCFWPLRRVSTGTRLFALDPGSGYNLGMALVGALVCVLASGVAWTVSGRETLGDDSRGIPDGLRNTGASAYLALTMEHANPNNAGIGMIDFQRHSTLWDDLKPMYWQDRPELIAPGAWNWIGDLHSNTFGLLLILLMSLSLVEILRRRRTNWPWICHGCDSFLHRGHVDLGPRSRGAHPAGGLVLDLA